MGQKTWISRDLWTIHLMLTSASCDCGPRDPEHTSPCYPGIAWPITPGFHQPPAWALRNYQKQTGKRPQCVSSCSMSTHIAMQVAIRSIPVQLDWVSITNFSLASGSLKRTFPCILRSLGRSMLTRCETAGLSQSYANGYFPSS
ncbi:hypothetical protein HYFRA_00012772 [Hymenoscyphus fraxineus]|uniref:Uncharacterized protein n=1 Tax=Hymenoscyphus fraxineus TaxID=746836 RepID=A0A9N9LB46_9HELO|nr:hypothetical protein HYFRA_00012772 [Hymenoscyphus fraxineus]